ncbi:hypothetical protein TRVL_02566 [Trypanosoma vivax]|nr:hypothetical protein TRVL_02566 [Trypanosoma vivax]
MGSWHAWWRLTSCMRSLPWAMDGSTAKMGRWWSKRARKMHSGPDSLPQHSAEKNTFWTISTSVLPCATAWRDVVTKTSRYTGVGDVCGLDLLAPNAKDYQRRAWRGTEERRRCEGGTRDHFDAEAAVDKQAYKSIPEPVLQRRLDTSVSTWCAGPLFR